MGERRVTFVCTARNSANIRIIARHRLIGPENKYRVSVVIGIMVYPVRVRMPRVYCVHGKYVRENLRGLYPVLRKFLFLETATKRRRGGLRGRTMTKMKQTNLSRNFVDIIRFARGPPESARSTPISHPIFVRRTNAVSRANHKAGYTPDSFTISGIVLRAIIDFIEHYSSFNSG